jgi:type I restriction enzyme S subunit
MAKSKQKELTIEEKLEQALVSEEEQPYEVQSNWVWTRIGIVSSLYRGVTYKKSNVHTTKENNDCLIMRGGNIKEGQIDICAEDNVYVDKSLVSDTQLIKVNDIIIVTSTGSTKVIGRAGISDSDYSDVAFGAFLTLVRPIDSINKRYVALYFQSDNYRNRIRELASGVNINNIRNEYITETCIPLTPLAEQQRIVDRIESLFEKLDNAKELVQNALDAFETRKAAILHKAFTGELTAQWRDKNGVGMDSWEEKQISEICDVVRGGSPRPAGDPQYYDGNIPFMKVADITRNIGPYVYSTEYSIKEAGLKKTRMVESNTLLLTNSGATLGVPAICTFQTTFNDGIAAFLNLDERSVKFLYYFFSSKTSELRSINKGAAQPNLNTEIIGSMLLNLPSIPEQQEIVRILDGLLEKDEQAKQFCDIIDKVDLLKKAILARAFRGELGTNDPNEESAIELLKEVLTKER